MGKTSAHDNRRRFIPAAHVEDKIGLTHECINAKCSLQFDVRNHLLVGKGEKSHLVCLLNENCIYAVIKISWNWMSSMLMIIWNLLRRKGVELWVV